MARALFLVMYDISCPRRLARALHAAREHATGGQKSVHECFLDAAELARLRQALHSIIDPSEDSLLFIRLDPRQTPRTLGLARAPADPAFFYVG
ncbi:MAG: CRISPR-associated endonuclease Cas2 [Acetobacteraceae bacterium]